MKTLRILILEDNDLLGPSLVRSLRRRGHMVVLRTTIGAATLTLQEVIDEPPDIILCDRDLPDGNGWDWGAKQQYPVRYMSAKPADTEQPFWHKGAETLEMLYELIEK